MKLEQRPSFFKRNLKWSLYVFLTYFRMLSAADRALPDFIIAGAQKAGTSSLYAYLKQHPNIIRAFGGREVHYWDKPSNYKKGLLWYRAHFPLRQELQTASAITGEKTPNYLENPEYIKKIKQDLPAAKLIVLLRNPVDRTISNYYMELRRGFEDLPIMDALLSEEERLVSPKEQKRYGMRRGYKMRSVYAPSIRACLDLFPREQILILDAASFFRDPHLILKDVYGFLGVSTDHVPEIASPKNPGGYNKASIPQEVYTYLQNYFRHHNEELYTLLNRDFGWDEITPGE